ncbi:hypothetical protein Tco_1457919 [Tanacetum coccineum]
MDLCMENREHGRMILESVKHGPLIRPTIEENGVTKTKKYAELSATEKIQADCDLKATNIILQGLPSDVYSLVNHHRVAKDLWERVQLLMQGTSLTKQERECKLYDAFDKFAHIKGESLHHLPPEWSKFVTDVKLVRDLHTTNFDQLNAYLEQHELHANEVRIMRERSQDPLALVANHQMTPSHFNTYQSLYNNPQFQQQFSPSQSPQYGPNHPTQHYSTTYPSTPLAINCPSAPYLYAYSSTVHQDAYSCLAVLVFRQGGDPIDAINKMMSFLSTVVTSRFPSTNNQLRNSSNPRQQATINDGRVTVQPVQERQSLFAAGGGYMARQCLKPKRKRDVTWFRDKVLLVEAQGSGKVLNEEELAFLADPRVAEGPVTQTVITHNASYQADDLDAYDSNCDDISTAKAVLMANLSSYGSDVLSEYLLETQNAVVQDTNSSAQQDAMILSVFEQLLNQVTNCNKVNKDNLIANESLYAELERYKERVKFLEERKNMDLSTKEKLIIYDIILDKNAQFADFEKEINSLKQTLSEQLKEKETLKTTFNVLKNKSKEKEAKNIDKEIALEKKVTELDNIFYKMGQSIRLMLYDGSVIAKETNVISFVDSEETLMLKEES